MQFNNDERHGEILTFMAEVRDYIASWPAHAMNSDMLTKIDAHLENPLNRLVKEGKKRRSGGNYTAAGLPVITAELEGDKLTITAPAKGKGIADAGIAHKLRQGVVIALKPAALVA